MPSEIQQLIDRLREAEYRRHRESVQAIDALERNMLGGGPSSGERGLIGRNLHTASTNRRTSRSPSTNVDRVLDALDAHEFRPVEEIVRRCNLDEVKVRAALYGRSTRSRIQKRRKGKRMTFRLATQPISPVPDQGADTEPSASEQVRALLRQHPAGLRVRDVRKALPNIKATTIGTALYNMKNKAKTVSYDKRTQIYRLVAAGSEGDVAE